MKKIALITVISIILFACNKEAPGYSITGNLTGFNESETVYVNKISVKC